MCVSDTARPSKMSVPIRLDNVQAAVPVALRQHCCRLLRQLHCHSRVIERMHVPSRATTSQNAHAINISRARILHARDARLLQPRARTSLRPACPWRAGRCKHLSQLLQPNPLLRKPATRTHSTRLLHSPVPLRAPVMGMSCRWTLLQVVVAVLLGVASPQSVPPTVRRTACSPLPHVDLDARQIHVSIHCAHSSVLVGPTFPTIPCTGPR